MQNTHGAAFRRDLDLPPGAIIITKGDNAHQDAYSAFQGHADTGTLLEEVLQQHGIRRLFVGGLATDHCVRATVLDGVHAGFAITVLLDAIRGVNITAGDSDRALAEMVESGVNVTTHGRLDL